MVEVVMDANGVAVFEDDRTGRVYVQTDDDSAVSIARENRLALAAAIAGEGYTLVESSALGPIADVEDGPETELGGMTRTRFRDALAGLAIHGDIGTTYAQKPVGSDEEEDEFHAIADRHFARRNNRMREMVAWFDRVVASRAAQAARGGGEDGS